jgi:hypothetical protein
MVIAASAIIARELGPRAALSLLDLARTVVLRRI